MSRRKYRYNPDTKAVVEITPDWTDAPRRAPVATEELTYGKLQALDGTPLDSRKKHREYMQANNLALMSDFTNTWARAEKERAEVLSSPQARRERREDIARAAFELTKRRR